MSLKSNFLLELNQLRNIFHKYVDFRAYSKLDEYAEFIDEVKSKKSKLQVINILIGIASYLLIFQFLGLYTFSLYKDTWNPNLTYLIMAYIILADLVCLASGAFLYHTLNRNEIENKIGTVKVFIWITMLTLINLNYLITFCSAYNGGRTLGVILITSFLLSAMMLSRKERKIITIYMFILFCIGIYIVGGGFNAVFIEANMVFITELVIFNLIGSFFVKMFKNMTAIKFSLKSKIDDNNKLKNQVVKHQTKEKLILDILEDELLHHSIDFKKYDQLDIVETVSYLFENYSKNVISHQKTFQDIFRHIEHGIVILDKDNHVIDYNLAAQVILEISEGTIHNSDFFDHFQLTGQQDVTRFNLNLLNNGATEPMEWLLHMADGENKKIYMRSIAQFDQNSVFVGSYNFIKEAAPHVNTGSDAIYKSSRESSRQFVVDSRLVLESSYFQNFKVQESISDETNLESIDSFLEWLDVDMAEYQFESKTFRLIEYLSSKQQELANHPSLGSKEIQINIKSTPEYYYQAQPEVLDYYFDKLIAKTIEEGIKESLTIHIEMEKIDHKNDFIKFHFVSDMPANYTLEKRIHLRFMVTKKNKNQEVSSIFSCWDESVGFQILMQKVSNASDTNIIVPIAYHNSRDMTVVPHILVVDDNQINRLQMAKLFKKWQFRADFAVNGLEAVKKCSFVKYDVIFMDLLMNDMDGYESTLAIRNSENLNQNTPIIAMTALINPSQTSQVIKVGMNDFIPKPIKPNQLYKTLLLYLDHKACTPHSDHRTANIQELLGHYKGDVPKAILSVQNFIDNHKSDLLHLSTIASQLSQREFLIKINRYQTLTSDLGLSVFFEILVDIKEAIIDTEHRKFYMPLVDKSAEQFKICFSSIQELLDKLKQIQLQPDFK